MRLPPREIPRVHSVRSRSVLLRRARVEVCSILRSDVLFPAKAGPDGALIFQTPRGSFRLLGGSSELWELGRFFTRCASDAKESNHSMEPTPPD